MLISMTMENVGSIREPYSINFSKSKIKYKEHMTVEDKIVNPIGVYGSNGSGKTVFLKILAAVSQMMYKDIDGRDIRLIPNMLFVDNKPMRVVLEMLLNGKNIAYELEILGDSEIIINERLSVNGKDVIIRDDKLIKSTDSIEIGISHNSPKLYLKELVGDISKLPILRIFGQSTLSDNEISEISRDTYDFISNITYIDVRGKVHSKITTGERINSLVVKHKDRIRELLQKYGDFPLFDLKLEDSSYTDEKVLLFKVDNGKWLHKDYMSAGMLVISELLAVLIASKNNSLVIVDEIERSIHPFVSNDFIDTFNREFNVQLIFSSHNTSILHTLRADQIIFSNWNSDKLQSEYKKLSDKYASIREVNNIEKMYFSRIFGDMFE